MSSTSVLFVCLGNICRSPTAEGTFRKVVEDSGMSGEVFIDSAGTGAWHVGEAPDGRSQVAAQARGIDLSSIVARQVTNNDMEKFDYILAMDKENLRNLHKMAGKEHRKKVSLFLEYSEKFTELEVPDPYYGGEKGFDLVLDLVIDASNGLLSEIRSALTR